MSLRWMTVLLIISVLSSCAFIDGLKNQPAPPPKPSPTQEGIIKTPAAVSAPLSNQNDAETNVAKMVSPLVQ